MKQEIRKLTPEVLALLKKIEDAWIGERTFEIEQLLLDLRQLVNKHLPPPRWGGWGGGP